MTLNHYTEKQLDVIFAPKTLAVIGASTSKGKVGHDIFENILKNGYTGTLYPVHPNAKSILSVRAYPSILKIDDNIDTAIIILSPKQTLEAVKDCIKAKVKGIIIVSAGFKEVGGEGAIIEKEITKLCKDAGICLIGPNCLGVINPVPEVSLNASFSARMPKAGNISFMSQSGALCTAVLDFAQERGFGFSKFISIGNKAGINEIDLLNYFHQDISTDVIMMYMEDIGGDVKEFIDVANAISSADPPTPILAIKSGKTAAGAAAAASHTGSLAGSDAAYNGIFDQAGILRCDTVSSLFDYATAFSCKRVISGNKIAIITNAGGPGILATDMTEHSGLKLAKFDESTIKELKKHLPPTANFYNPVDVIGDASSDRYQNAITTVLSDRNVDGALIILTPQSMTNAIGTANAIIEINKIIRKPIVCCFMGVVDVSAGVEILRNNSIPVYKFPEEAAKSLGGLYMVHRWQFRRRLPQYDIKINELKARELIDKFLKEGKTILDEKEGGELLACYGFNILPSKIATTKEEAIKFAEEIGYPVVLKIMSPQITHKTEARGVKLNLKTKDAVESAFEEIIQNAKDYNKEAIIEGALVQKMADPPVAEVILGVNRNEKFGPLVMFGLGGIFVELFKDIVFRVAPFGRNVARRMVNSIKSYPLLNGFRGREIADKEAIERMLVSLGKLVVAFPEIKELDINPLLVYKEGSVIADVVIKLEKITKKEIYNSNDNLE